ncbi:MAG: hypothetical protein IK136_02130 [Oscillospiraceae bacterium]|nr:hypothetical protein [Oscillospiraceae bacterium]
MEDGCYLSTGDPQAGRAAALCDVCRGEVWPGDLVHVINGFVVCPECFLDYTFDYFSDCLMLGSEIQDQREDTNDDAL